MQWNAILNQKRALTLGAAYNAKEMKPQAIEAFRKVTAGPAVESAKAALAELTK